jgi:hypothetical protein
VRERRVAFVRGQLAAAHQEVEHQVEAQRARAHETLEVGCRRRGEVGGHLLHALRHVHGAGLQVDGTLGQAGQGGVEGRRGSVGGGRLHHAREDGLDVADLLGAERRDELHEDGAADRRLRQVDTDTRGGGRIHLGGVGGGAA